MKKTMVLFIALLFPALFAACGGGGGGSSNNNTSTATALTVASKVGVVDAKLSGSVAQAAPLRISLFKVTAASLSSTSDYNADQIRVYVDERSAESMDTVNMILCVVAQTKYDAMLNKGTYVALVDKNQCDSKSSTSSSGQNQSSSVNMPNYMKFTVNSSRADNNSPEIIKAWVHDPDGSGDQPQLIYAKIVITEGTGTTNPYGIFTMNFVGYPIVNGTPDATAAMKGTLEAVHSVPTDPTSKVLLKFASTDSHMDNYCGQVDSSNAVALDKQVGAGHVKDTWTCPNNPSSAGTKEFDIAYNTADFYRKDPNTLASVCLSRTSFSESSWNFGLYDSTGTRLARNSGFPFSYTDPGTGTKYQGWIGYWGLWTNGNLTIPNGATVDKMAYNGGSSTSTPYTVFEAGGKLHKHTRELLTLNDIKNIPLSYNVWSGGTGTNYEVVYDGINFNEIAYMPQNCGNNCNWKDMISTPIDLTTLQQGNLNMWADSLGGQAQVQLVSCTTPSCGMNGCITSCSLPAPTAQSVIFYADSIVYPGDTVPANLECYDNCPTVVSGQATMPNMMSEPSNTPTNYTFDTTRLMLQWSNLDVISTVTNSMQQWGIGSGPLFDPSLASQLACPWNPAQTCGWMAWSVLPVFYTWETGPNNWNQFIGLKDASNAFVKFDPPLQVKYVGSGDPYGSLGTTYMLEYSGIGQLNGIPGKCVDLDTGLPADCSQQSSSIQWVPQFIIPPLTNGNLTTVTDNSNNTYYVKPLEVEQRMNAAPIGDAASCSTLAATDFSAYTLPDISLWDDPSAAIGPEPTVTTPPAVIGGVVQ